MDTDRPEVTTTPSSSLNTKTKIVVGTITALMIIAAMGITYLVMKPASDSSLALHGSVTIKNPFGSTSTYMVTSDGGCAGAGGYSDISPGAIVQLSDGAGHVVGTGALDGGGKQVSMADGTGTYGCKLAFTIANVPNEDTYVLAVANRSPMVETPAQVRTGIDLTIG